MDDESGEELGDAAKRGDLSRVRALLERGAQINYQDGIILKGFTALHYSAIYGHLEVARLLLDRSANINMKGYGGRTALHYSAMGGHLELARLLLDRSADIDMKDSRGRTALHYSAMGGHLELARLLLDRAAKINIKDDERKTTMKYAREGGHSAIVALIAEKSRMSSEERRASAQEYTCLLPLFSFFNYFYAAESSVVEASIAVPLQTASKPSASLSSARAFLPVEKDKYHVFLTHTWAKDSKGRDSHLRVGRVNAYLQSRGIACWFDSERMQGSIRRLMTKGIEDSMAMIVFLQRTYIDKVNGDEERDNCRYEFNHGFDQKGPQNMLAVIMEETIRNPRDWKGEVGGALGTKLYVDFSSDEFDSDSAFFTAKCEELIQQLKSLPALRPYLIK